MLARPLIPRILHVGCAGWRQPRDDSDGRSHLARYADRFDAVEINSSFYRSHRRTTFERWAAAVPPAFRFAVKLPRTITHDHRLRDVVPLLAAFFEEVGGLREKFGCVLVQLPPSLPFAAATAESFFGRLRDQSSADVACEPRHTTWFSLAASKLLLRHRVARVVADPPIVANKAILSCDPAYVRLHGSPDMYYSEYSESELTTWAERLAAWRDAGRCTWCIFDNTAAGAATLNAARLRQLTASAEVVRP